MHLYLMDQYGCLFRNDLGQLQSIYMEAFYLHHNIWIDHLESTGALCNPLRTSFFWDAIVTYSNLEPKKAADE